MSDDLIKRSDAIKVVRHISMEFVDADTRQKLIEALPSADRPQGEWTPCTKKGLPLTELGRRERQVWYGYKCSKCNFIYKGNALTESPFCQNCGRRMKGANNGEDIQSTNE